MSIIAALGTLLYISQMDFVSFNSKLCIIMYDFLLIVRLLLLCTEGVPIQSSLGNDSILWSGSSGSAPDRLPSLPV